MAVPPSNLSLLGLVRHMSDAERGWVRQTFRGEQIPDLYYRADAPDADFKEADPAGAEEDFELYRAECRAVDAALEGAKLDDTFTFREKTHLGAVDVAAPRGGVRAPQRTRRPAPRSHRRLGRPLRAPPRYTAMPG